MLLRALEGWNRITPWLPLFPRGKACRAASCSVCNLPPWDVLGFGLLLSFLELSAIGIPHSPAIE
jgi:hypothetical protein